MKNNNPISLCPQDIKSFNRITLHKKNVLSVYPTSYSVEAERIPPLMGSERNPKMEY